MATQPATYFTLFFSGFFPGEYEYRFLGGIGIAALRLVVLIIMKGTKVLTLGAGREVLPHNVAVTKAAYIYTRPLAIRMRYMCIYACAVLLIGGRAGPIFDSWSLTSLLRVGHRVATQHAGVDTRPAVQFLAPPRYAELSR